MATMRTLRFVAGTIVLNMALADDSGSNPTTGTYQVDMFYSCLCKFLLYSQAVVRYISLATSICGLDDGINYAYSQINVLYVWDEHLLLIYWSRAI